MQIKHVFFDLDHTLWDFERNSALAFQEIFLIHNIDISLEEFLNIYIPLNLDLWKLYREDKISKSLLRYKRLKDTFSLLNMEVSDDIINQLSDDYITYLPKFNYLFNGSVELLDYLKNSYKLHIITNGFEEVQIKKMKASNIFNYFDTIITSESVGVKKPNPEIFKFSLEKAIAKAQESIMIGDNLEADIQGAISSGLSAIHCNFDKISSIPQNITSVQSLLEIKQYL